MPMSYGFSLTEVLIAICLMASLSLSLLTQQWRINQLFNQVNTRNQALNYLDNVSERLMAHAPIMPVVKPYQLEINAELIQIQWDIRDESFILERWFE